MGGAPHAQPQHAMKPSTATTAPVVPLTLESSRNAPRTPAPGGFAELFAAARQPARAEPERPVARNEAAATPPRSSAEPSASTPQTAAHRPETPARQDETPPESTRAQTPEDAEAPASQAPESPPRQPANARGAKARAVKSEAAPQDPAAPPLSAAELPMPELDVKAAPIEALEPAEESPPDPDAQAPAVAALAGAAPDAAPALPAAIDTQTPAAASVKPATDRAAASPTPQPGAVTAPVATDAAPVRTPLAQRPMSAEAPSANERLADAQRPVERAPVGKAVVKPAAPPSDAPEAAVDTRAQPVAPSTPELLQRMSAALAPPAAEAPARRSEGTVALGTLWQGVAGPQASSGSPAAAPQVSAALSRAPGQAGFAQELGAQISVWARDGVQQAQLLLSPAELGPVRVQIQIEGQQAQLQFAAEHPLTREALQQGLGQLAQSLQQGGLSLGRSDVQSQWQGGQGQGQSREGGGGDRWQGSVEDEALQLAPRQRPSASGLLDLYA